MTHETEWTHTTGNGVELRVMRLPERKALYLVLTDTDGMRCVARTLGDREASALVSWLTDVTGGGSP